MRINKFLLLMLLVTIAGFGLFALNINISKADCYGFVCLPDGSGCSGPEPIFCPPGIDYSTAIGATVNGVAPPAGFVFNYSVIRGSSGGGINTYPNTWDPLSGVTTIPLIKCNPDSAQGTAPDITYLPYNWSIGMANNSWPSGYYLKEPPSILGGVNCATGSGTGFVCGRQNQSCLSDQGPAFFGSKFSGFSETDNPTQVQSSSFNFCSYGTINVTTSGLSAGQTASFRVTGPFGSALPIDGTNFFDGSVAGGGATWSNSATRVNANGSSGTYSISNVVTPPGYEYNGATVAGDVACAAGQSKTFVLNFSSVSQPDLIIQSANITGSLVAGQALSFGAIVKNQETVSAGAISLIGLQIDIDNNNSWNIIAPNQNTGNLSGGATETETWSNAWTNITAGTHAYRVCADVSFSVVESNEGNNCLTQTFVVSTPPTNGSCIATPVTQNGASYVSSATDWDSKPFCNVGTASPLNPSFPASGSFTAWQCLGSNGGSNASCSASRASIFPTYALTIASQNPDSGVLMTVTPDDINVFNNGSTQFVRTYNQGANIEVQAPSQSTEGNNFTNWTGCSSTSGAPLATTCHVDNLSSNKTITAIYTTPPPAAICSISADPTPINPGSPSTLTWSSSDATSCTANQSWSGSKATNGSENVYPNTTSSYGLTCSGDGGAGSCQTVVEVNSSPENPTCAITPSSFSGGVPLNVSATVAGSGGSGSGYVYSTTYGDSGTGTGTNLNHTYSTAGTYVIMTTVRDSNSNTGTCTASVLVTTIQWPDLTPRDFVPPPPSVVIGQSYALSAKAKNQGTANAGASTGRFCVNTNQNSADCYSSSATGQLSAPSIPALAANSTTATPFSSNWTPSSAGTYYTHWCVDVNGPDGVILESNETNNCTSSGAIAVSAPSLPDLLPENFNAPSSVVVGSSYVISSKVKNQSDIGTGVGFSSRFCVTNSSSQDCYDSSPTGPIGVMSLGVLAAGGLSPQLNASWTPFSSGTYYAYFCSDVNNPGSVAESNEGNNCTSSGAIAVSAPVAGTLNVASARCADVSCEVVAEGVAPVNFLLTSNTALSGNFSTQYSNPSSPAGSYSASFLSKDASLSDVLFNRLDSVLNGSLANGNQLSLIFKGDKIILNGGSCTLSGGSCSVNLTTLTDYNSVLRNSPSYEFNCGDGVWHSTLSNAYSCAYFSSGNRAVQVKAIRGNDTAIATALISVGEAVCPTDQSVVATPNSIAVNDTTEFSAPAGWSDGAFISSELSVLDITGTIGKGLKPGQVSVSGSGWKYNGISDCSLLGAIVTVKGPVVTLSVSRRGTGQWVDGTSSNPGVLWINKKGRVDLKYAFQDFPNPVISCVRELGVSSWRNWQGEGDTDKPPKPDPYTFQPIEPISSGTIPFKVTCTDGSSPPGSADAVVNIHIYPIWREINPGATPTP